ncbi:uncharacterized protein SETTUDRAFT_164746 [Exserohilum turcica Et28A]|uniref:Uncharacterized protein n=1 Tax=Exserohilum turcicum (strain 28A) TaxID=671987 RepID=R0K4Q1_EXST2|nr:uncharacterized protein SETTUDRAFT_164746 [Exserohilum turcica Et28A]EOA83322.1 hypothetical protein SETTUDRAFT_164746 [Exserohilum turcica Et28A]
MRGEGGPRPASWGLLMLSDHPPLPPPSRFAPWIGGAGRASERREHAAAARAHAPPPRRPGDGFEIPPW